MSEPTAYNRRESYKNPRINRQQRMPKSRTQATQSPGSSRVLASLNRALSNQSLTKALAMSVEILRENSNHFDWVGIYLVRENDLVLEAYAGDEETEHVRIPIGEGICGSAAKEVLGEIDIESNRLSAFNQEDRKILEEAASLLARRIESQYITSHEPLALCVA